MSIDRDLTPEEELAIALEAARRANWAGAHGPAHLRTGRYRPADDTPDAAE